MANRFYDLEIWKIGYALLINIYKISSNFPKEEMYALVSQIRRSSNSVIANIAECHGRYFYADKVRVLYISRRELEETQSHLRVAGGLGYYNKDELRILDNKYEELNKKINQYIIYLLHQKKQISL